MGGHGGVETQQSGGRSSGVQTGASQGRAAGQLSGPTHHCILECAGGHEEPVRQAHIQGGHRRKVEQRVAAAQQEGRGGRRR